MDYGKQTMDTHNKISLRKTTVADLDTLFRFQLDKEAQYLAAFMPGNADDMDVYIAKHTRFLGDPTFTNCTILVGQEIAGSIAKFIMEGDTEITYWIDKTFWGQGIASAALKEFLKIETTRPIFGRVAFDNFGSQRVLEKCGFVKIGTDKGFASARQTEIEEFIYRLDCER